MCPFEYIIITTTCELNFPYLILTSSDRYVSPCPFISLCSFLFSWWYILVPLELLSDMKNAFLWYLEKSSFTRCIVDRNLLYVLLWNNSLSSKRVWQENMSFIPASGKLHLALADPLIKLSSRKWHVNDVLLVMSGRVSWQCCWVSNSIMLFSKFPKHLSWVRIIRVWQWPHQ